jgi:hypothetical protein
MDQEDKVESNITTKTTITLKLTEIEANYLKGLVQNPMCIDPKDEGDFERNMRQSFWDALSAVEPNKYGNVAKTGMI